MLYTVPALRNQRGTKAYRVRAHRCRSGCRIDPNGKADAFQALASYADVT